MTETLAELAQVGDQVRIVAIDNFGGDAIVVEKREPTGSGIVGIAKCKVLMVDRNPVDPFWVYDQEIVEIYPKGESYESRPDTLAHIEHVRILLGKVITDLSRRAAVHDQSKLVSPEVEIFNVMTPKLAGSTYGSEEYRSFLTEMKLGLDHHYAANDHHPEHFPPATDLVIPHLEGVVSAIHDCHYQATAIHDAGVALEREITWRSSQICSMNLVQLTEMLCDWKAATLRHHDGDIRKSIEINQKRFGYSDELKQILLNTLSLLES